MSAGLPPVVVLSGIRWGFLWQRHQQLAVLFARAGYPTTFVETTGFSNPRPGAAGRVLARLGGARTAPSGEPNLAVYAPLVAPPTQGVFRRLNARHLIPRAVRDLRALAGRAPVVVAYPPTRTTLDLIQGLSPRLVYYDRADDYASFPLAPRDIRETERDLIGRADLVSCTSRTLLREVRAVRPDAFLSGPAAEYDRFAVLQEEPGPEVRTVCSFGHLSRERTDFDALRAIADAGFRLRLVGGVGRMDRADRRLLGHPAVGYAGEVPHSKLPRAFSGVDAFVLPYRTNALTRGIAPAKTFECLATGKPVVAAPIPSMVELGDAIYTAKSARDYARVLASLAGVETAGKRAQRTELARANSWEERFKGIEEALWDRM